MDMNAQSQSLFTNPPVKCCPNLFFFASAPLTILNHSQAISLKFSELSVFPAFPKNMILNHNIDSGGNLDVTCMVENVYPEPTINLLWNERYIIFTATRLFPEIIKVGVVTIVVSCIGKNFENFVQAGCRDLSSYRGRFVYCQEPIILPSLVLFFGTF